MTISDAATLFITWVGPPGVLLTLWKIRREVQAVSKRVLSLEKVHQVCPVRAALLVEHPESEPQP